MLKFLFVYRFYINIGYCVYKKKGEKNEFNQQLAKWSKDTVNI